MCFSPVLSLYRVRRVTAFRPRWWHEVPEFPETEAVETIRSSVRRTDTTIKSQ